MKRQVVDVLAIISGELYFYGAILKGVVRVAMTSLYMVKISCTKYVCFIERQVKEYISQTWQRHLSGSNSGSFGAYPVR